MAVADCAPTSELCGAAPGISPPRRPQLTPELGPFLLATRTCEIGHSSISAMSKTGRLSRIMDRIIPLWLVVHQRLSLAFGAYVNGVDSEHSFSFSVSLV